LNSFFDLNCLFIEKDKCSSASLYALQLLWSTLFCFCDMTCFFCLYLELICVLQKQLSIYNIKCVSLWYKYSYDYILKNNRFFSSW
jgi:hypothetical protein